MTAESNATVLLWRATGARASLNPEQCLGMFAGRVSLPAEHAGQFGDAVFGGKEVGLGNRAADLSF